jgi:ABC-type transport system involved in Fe-S cluster assembly fused permease/ATPase subunit
VVLKGGRLEQEGQHDELIAMPGDYREVFLGQLVQPKVET